MTGPQVDSSKYVTSHLAFEFVSTSISSDHLRSDRASLSNMQMNKGSCCLNRQEAAMHIPVHGQPHVAPCFPASNIANDIWQTLNIPISWGFEFTRFRGSDRLLGGNYIDFQQERERERVAKLDQKLEEGWIVFQSNLITQDVRHIRNISLCRSVK